MVNGPQEPNFKMAITIENSQIQWFSRTVASHC
jgi:hypothetical protein